MLGVITKHSLYTCDSTNRTITISVLYGFKALIQVIALIFAFSLQKVKVKGLNDSPFIIACTYVSSIVLAVILMSSLTLKRYINASVAVNCTGFFIGTTIILSLVFIPKVCMIIIIVDF
jgi:gamma-aminobutyric acid type B receptor